MLAASPERALPERPSGRLSGTGEATRIRLGAITSRAFASSEQGRSLKVLCAAFVHS
jgi:hypothetical protein